MTARLNKYDPAWDDPQLLKKKRKVGIISVVVVLLVLIALTIVLGKPIIAAIRDKASFRQWMQGTGFWKYPLMMGIMALQVIIAFIPGEPIEIIAGYIFGGWMGMFLCLLGAALGSVVIILAVRKFGMKFVSLFVSREQIQNLKFFRNPKKRDATIFLLFLIPGTPKDILTYLAGLVPIHLGKYLVITSIARVPSVITSTMGGNLLGAKEYRYAIIIFAATLVLTLAATLLYQAHQKKHGKDEEDEEEKAGDEAAHPPANNAVQTEAVKAEAPAEEASVPEETHQIAAEPMIETPAASPAPDTIGGGMEARGNDDVPAQ